MWVSMEFVAENVGRASAHNSLLPTSSPDGSRRRCTKNLSLSKSVCVLQICGVVSCSSSFRSELASFWVFRTYLQGIEKNKIVFQYISQGHSSRIDGRERSRSEAAAESLSRKYCTYEREEITDARTFSFR